MKYAETCNECGGDIRLEERTQRFCYGSGDDSVELRAHVPVLICNACGDEFTDERAETARHAAVCAHLGRLSPAEIKAARTRYRLSQEDLAEITDFGIASIKRWETGNQIQNASADKFLRLLFSSRSALARASGLSAPQGVGPRFVTALSEDVQREASIFRLRDVAVCT